MAIATTAAVDAGNRAVRTFLQGLAIDVLAAAVLFLLPVLADANSLADVDFTVLGFMLAKTLLVTVLSYLARYFSIGKGTLTNEGANSV